jgi:hypothetical protein
MLPLRGGRESSPRLTAADHDGHGGIRSRCIAVDDPVFYLQVLDLFDEFSVVGTGKDQRQGIRRLDSSTTTRTMYRMSPTRVQTSTVKKSAAAIDSQCALRNFFHGVCSNRSGAGLMPCSARIRRTVYLDT